jgi:hypothetical protein
MNVKNLLCLVSALSLATVSVAQAQSLTELAKQEKQRRAKLRTAGAPTKVYTENDRSTQPVEAVPVDAAAPTAADPLAAASGAPKEKTRDEINAERQKEWADKVKAAQDEITGLEAVITKNERNLASLINITPARQDLANAIEADKKRLAELKQTLVSLEDERRRAGMPRR